MIKVYVNYEEEKKANCNGGNYPQIWVVDDQNEDNLWMGRHCGCWRGCSNTTSRQELQEMFPEWDGELTVLESDEFLKLDKILFERYRNLFEKRTHEQCKAMRECNEKRDEEAILAE